MSKYEQKADKPKLDYSHLIVSKGVGDWMDTESGAESFVSYCMGGMMKRNWGRVSDLRKAANENAIKSGNRLIGLYTFIPHKWINSSGGNSLIMIVLDAVKDEHGNRGPITALFPDEYSKVKKQLSKLSRRQ